MKLSLSIRHCHRPAPQVVCHLGNWLFEHMLDQCDHMDVRKAIKACITFTTNGANVHKSADPDFSTISPGSLSSRRNYPKHEVMSVTSTVAFRWQLPVDPTRMGHWWWPWMMVIRAFCDWLQWRASKGWTSVWVTFPTSDRRPPCIRYPFHLTVRVSYGHDATKSPWRGTVRGWQP